MSPDEIKMKKGVVGELRKMLSRMEVDSLDDVLYPKEKIDAKIITKDEGAECLEKALPKPTTALDLEAVEGSSKEGMEGSEPKYPSSTAVMSNQEKEERGLEGNPHKKKDEDESY